MTERLEDTLRRLEREREEADTRYNDALTELDRARPSLDPTPAPAPALDEHQLPALNQAWNIIPESPRGSGIKSRAAGLIWRAVAPYFQRQLAFNSLLVDHLNRTAAAAREAQRADEESRAALAERFAALNEFTARLLVYLQQITAYVDTKDRRHAGDGLVLNAALSAMAETLDKRWESLNVRVETRTAALSAGQESLQAAVAVAQQAAFSLKRELERPGVAEGSPVPAGVAALSGPDPHQAFSLALDAFKYLGFEDRFRGSRDLIRQRLESYLPIFEGAQDVLDVGCGRGEFLELLAGAGVRARGIDLNHEMAEQCRARGLDVVEADAAGFLADQPDGSLGGLFAAQVVEHLDPSYLLRLLELAYHKLRPGSRIVLETLNPACWVAFFDSYIRDITHVWPLHPDTLQYLVLASGFSSARIEYRSPVPDEQKLQPSAPARDPALAPLIDAFNENMEKLNARMFTYLDYAVVGEK